MEESGQSERGIFLCRVPERHDSGHRDIVRETAFSSMTCCFQSPLNGQYLGEWGKNRHVNTWIYVIFCGNKSWREKKCMVLFIFLWGSMLKKKVRSTVETSA